MSLGAVGSRARFYWKEESVAGTAPAGDWDQFPAFSLRVGTAPSLNADSILSSGTTRDAADPYQGVARVEGQAVVPVDTVHFGKWLQWMMGDATSSGSTNFTHVFKSGAATLTTRAIEKAFLDLTRYEVAAGARANGFEIGVGPDGSAQATVPIMCLSEALAGSSAAGTPVVTAYTRFFATQGSISRAGSALAGVTAGTIRFSNGFTPVPTIGSGTGIGGIDAGESTGGGSITARFASHTLRTASIANTAASISFAYTIDANTSVTFLYPRCFLEPITTAVEGPSGITQQFNFTAAFDASEACLLKVTLKNQVAAYTG
jgi:hypothetical protein